MLVLDKPDTCAVTRTKSEYNAEDGDSAETTTSQKLDNDGTATHIIGIKIHRQERAGRPVD